MTPEYRKGNWKNAHDLYWVRARARFSVEQIADAFGLEPKLYRKMERNKIKVPREMVGRAQCIAEDYYAMMRGMKEQWNDSL